MKTILLAALLAIPLCGAPAVVAHTGFATLNTGTSSAIDTTGANFIVVNVSGCSAGTGCDINSGILSDSKMNTWTRLTPQGSNAFATLFYSASPTVGSGHTFTITATVPAVAVQIIALSGVKATAPFDQQTGQGGSIGSTDCPPGAITASAANSLFVTGFEKENDTGAYPIDSGFTVSDQTTYTPGSNFGGAMAWKVSSGTENPDWGATVAGRTGCAMATFLPAAPTSTPSGYATIM